MIDLRNGDCLELLKTLDDNSVDAVVTDPPYGTTACEWDSVIDYDLMWCELKRISKEDAAIVFFSAQPFTSSLVMSNPNMFKYEWIWEKHQATNFLNAKKQPLRAHENIVVFYSKQCTYNPQKTKGHRFVGKYKQKQAANIGVYRNLDKKVPYADDGTRYPKTIQKFDYDKERYNSQFFKNRHPTQKPVKLLEYLIKTYTNKGDVVLDFTMGSGTTGIAAVNLNRSFIGFELDKDYFEIAQKRIAAAQIEKDKELF